MGQFGARRPSAALVVAIIALVVAASGTAVATTRLVGGDSLIRKHSLSADRLRAGGAGEVVRAHVAAEAQALGGHPASAFELASSDVRSGLVTASGGQTVKLASFGPFTVSLQCNDDGGGTFDAQIVVTSTTSNAEAADTPLTAGTPQEIDDVGPDSIFADNAGGTLVDFVAAPDAYMGYLIDSIFMPGTGAPCAASLMAAKS